MRAREKLWQACEGAFSAVVTTPIPRVVDMVFKMQQKIGLMSHAFVVETLLFRRGYVFVLTFCI